MMKSKILLSLITAAICSSAFAIEEERSVKVRLLALGDAASTLVLPRGFKETSVALLPDTRSAVLLYRGPATLDLQEKPPGKRVYSADLSKDDSDELLVVLLPGADEARTLILEDSPRRFPAGSILASNLTVSPLKFSFGEEDAILAPGESRIIPLPAGRPAVMVRVSLSESEELLFSNNWAVQPASRSLLLLLPSSESNQNRPRVFRLAEIVPGS